VYFEEEASKQGSIELYVRQEQERLKEAASGGPGVSARIDSAGVMDLAALSNSFNSNRMRSEMKSARR
jgi:hypothetical protein